MATENITYTVHNGTGKSTAKHNDRSMYENGYPDRYKNEYWQKYKDEENFKDNELRFYDEEIGSWFSKKLKRDAKKGKKPTAVTMEEYYLKKQPQELILALGNKGNRISDYDLNKEILIKMKDKSIDKITEVGGEVLDYCYHADEKGVPHFQIRYAMRDEKGQINVNGCLRNSGKYELPAYEMKRQIEGLFDEEKLEPAEKYYETPVNKRNKKRVESGRKYFEELSSYDYEDIEEQFIEAGVEDPFVLEKLKVICDDEVNERSKDKAYSDLAIIMFEPDRNVTWNNFGVKYINDLRDVNKEVLREYEEKIKELEGFGFQYEKITDELQNQHHMSVKEYERYAEKTEIKKKIREEKKKTKDELHNIKSNENMIKIYDKEIERLESDPAIIDYKNKKKKYEDLLKENEEVNEELYKINENIDVVNDFIINTRSEVMRKRLELSQLENEKESLKDEDSKLNKSLDEFIKFDEQNKDDIKDKMMIVEAARGNIENITNSRKIYEETISSLAILSITSKPVNTFVNTLSKTAILKDKGETFQNILKDELNSDYKGLIADDSKEYLKSIGVRSELIDDFTEDPDRFIKSLEHQTQIYSDKFEEAYKEISKSKHKGYSKREFNRLMNEGAELNNQLDENNENGINY